MYHQVVLNLLGKNKDPGKLKGTSYDEDKMRKHHIKANDLTAFFYIYFHRLTLCFLTHRHEESYKNAERGEKYLDSIAGSLLVPVFYFYQSLSRLAIFESMPKSKQRLAMSEIARHQKKLKRWAEHAPMNHLHKYYRLFVIRN